VDNFGFMGGVEFAATRGLRLTGEFHVLHEFGFGLMLQFFL
jgi:hypothetical protein